MDAGSSRYEGRRNTISTAQSGVACMASMVGASNALEARLAELAGFGLGRPANVLFSEYVKVLVTREVIDAATAERLRIGFYAAHYGDPNGENPDVAEAIERLEGVINRLAAMPVEARV